MRAAAVEQECTGAGGEEGGGQATATAAAGVAAGVNTATAAAVPPRIEEAGGIERFREFANPPGVHGKPSKHTCRGFQLVPGNIWAWYEHETGAQYYLLTVHSSTYSLGEQLTKRFSKNKSKGLAPPPSLLTLAQLEQLVA